MTKSTLFLIVLLIILGGAYVSLRSKGNGNKHTPPEVEQLADWKEFIPPSRSFKVRLPALPQYANDIVEIPDSDKKRRYEIFASEKVNGTLFMISMITYPPELDTSNTKGMLEGIIEELMLSKKDNRLKEITQSLHESRESLDFSLDSKEFDIHGRAFMVGKTLYVLTYIARKSDFDASELKYFIDSFGLLPAS